MVDTCKGGETINDLGILKVGRRSDERVDFFKKPATFWIEKKILGENFSEKNFS